MHKAISEFEAGIRAAAVSCLASARKGLSMARAVFTSAISFGAMLTECCPVAALFPAPRLQRCWVGAISPDDEPPRAGEFDCCEH